MTMILELTAPSQNESSIASPKVVRVLPVLRALFESLGRAGVRYCHWKSNWRLPEALRGETDLDLLVHRADRSRFLSLVGALGLKPASGEDHPSVWHCYGCDDESGRLFDLHVYYRLITGGTIKGYHLPVEEMLLRGARPSATVARSRRAWRKAWRTLRGGTPTQALLSGGAVIGVVGSDGSGKSTVVAEMSRWLGEFLSVATIHGGKPPPSVPTALPRLLLPLLRRMMPRYRTTRIELRAAEGAEPEGMRTGPLLVYALRALMLAYDRKKLLIRAHRKAANGTLVLSDRYPTRQPGVPEGAMLHFLRDDRRPLYRWLARVEERTYRAIPQPDLVLRLDVPLELAVQRNLTRIKPGGPEPTEYLRQRHAKSSELEFAGVPTYP